MSEAILANANLVLPDRMLRGAVTLRDGRIADIAEGSAAPAGTVDCGGDLVMPGLIELHTDNLERHIQPRPKVDWPHANAIVAHDAELASVGITTVFDALRVGSIPDGQRHEKAYARDLATELVQMRDAHGLRISHFLHLRAEICSETLVDELASFSAGDRVGLVSLMDHTPGQRQFRDLSKLKTYAMSKNGMTEDQFTEHVAQLRSVRERFGATHEDVAVAEARRLGAILASHDDTTPEQADQSAERGVRLAEFPTTREAAEALRTHGIAVMMGAPNLVRGGSHSGNVAASELAADGLLDIVSSDYVPAALLMAAVMLGDLWDDLPRGIATVTRAPADAANLPDRGRIEAGARADLIRVSRWAGTPMVRETWVRGRRVA
ncbi:alpha-D-ribose 1-methylphosphonate 5-triphosphate diphosphatase [Tranquillimonas rosea]|uniref:alpha-D-ribose 1-methylphosphonate 5-triphosphate diphosphatase n=1 Tax=Tranquillimonas rosea TaxID=641238 RepID=UPI003BACC154